MSVGIKLLWHLLNHTRRIAAAAALLLLTSPTVARAQRISFGVIGGTNVTRDTESYRLDYLDSSYPAGLTAYSRYSDTHSVIVGPTFEFSFSRSLSAEVDALHRSLVVKRSFTFPDGTTQFAGTDSVGTWEWPVLLKYRVPFGRVRPFVEAGPSFRTRKNPGATEPSQFGGTAGAGAEFRVGAVRIAPMLRYTRWQYDGPYPRYASKRDQIEFLTGVTYDVSPGGWKVRGRKFWFGAIAGTPLTRAFHAETIEEEHGYAVGLAAEFEVADQFSLEFDGLYRPLRAFSVGSFNGVTYRDPFTVLTWEFPMLVKYARKTSRACHPIVEGGPSFRAAGNRNAYNPSHFGLTAGAGVETLVRGVKIGPVLRYTRWAPDASRFSYIAPTGRNQVELLVGITF